MIGWLTALGLSARVAKLVVWAALLAGVIAALWWAYGTIYERGEAAADQRAATAHAEAVATAREDERTAQTVTERAQDAAVARDVATRVTIDLQTKGLTDALAQDTGDRGGAVSASVRDRSNSIVDLANRAARYTGPASRTDAD